MPETQPRHTISGSERALPNGARQVGTPAPDSELSVTLRLRGQSGGRAAPIPSGAPMSREDYASRYGTSRGDLELVERFAHDHGLTLVQVSAARRTAILSGRVEQMQAAFGVTLHTYALNGTAFRGRSGTVSVPTELGRVVEGVFGLDDRPQARPQFRYATPPTGGTPISEGVHPRASASAGFAPTVLARAYDFPQEQDGALLDGSGQTVAIIELGGGYRKADLDTYFRGLGLRTPHVSAVAVDGGRNAPTTAQGADGEVMLDIEVVGATAPGARIAVYFAPNTDAGFLNAVTQAAHDDARRPSVISISWGSAEPRWTQQAMTAMTEAFQAAALMGVTVLCAAGDDGSDDGVGDGQPHTDFPASSPWATGCGGTRLMLDGETITGEVVWNNGPGHGGTGGGVSEVFPLPDYQQGVGVPAPAGSSGGRGVPDVAGVGDPQTGYQVRVDGQNLVIGGTSAVAPLWAGLVARLNQALEGQSGGPVGFLNARLYPLRAANGSYGGVHDIVQGNNGIYSAGPGWDACTGLGSPDGTALLAALMAGGSGARKPPGDAPVSGE